MHDTERDRIFGEWLAGHKGILFKVVHAYAFEQLVDRFRAQEKSRRTTNSDGGQRRERNVFFELH